MAAYLFEDQELPEGFRFPPSFVEMVSREPLPHPDPWWFLTEFPDDARFWLKYLRDKYPARSLVPFAKRDMFDDIASFDGTDRSGNPAVHYVHVGASPGWEDRGSVPSFEAWLEAASDD